MNIPRINHRTLGVIYVLAVVIAIFGVWIPDRFLAYNTFADVLNTSAIACLVALSLVLPLAAGLFDFSIGYTLGFTGILVAYLLGHGVGVGPAIAITIVAGVVIGAINGIVIVGFKVDSFIGTLATGSLLFAGILVISGDQQLTAGVSQKGFANVAQASWHQLTIPVAYAVVLGVALWLVLNHTPTGRRIQATGLSLEAARLAGVRTNLLRFLALVASATIAGFAGIINTAQIGTGSPDIGPSFLIPAYAAVFLGKTQSGKSLFNTWGTVASVILLGTTTSGLALTGAPIWAPYVVTGVVLIASIGIANIASGRGFKLSKLTSRMRTIDPGKGVHASA
jgi:ribose transport system permease protein